MDDRHNLCGGTDDIHDPRCHLLSGFIMSVRKTEQCVGLIVDRSQKAMISSSIGSLISSHAQSIRNTSHLKEEIQQFTAEHFEKKSAILGYNKREITMYAFDCALNENSTFNKRSGDTFVQVSYRQYIHDRFGVDSPEREHCVVKVGYEPREQIFLPQHLYITASNEKLGQQRAEEIKDIIEQRTPNDILRFIQQFIEHANQRCVCLYLYNFSL